MPRKPVLSTALYSLLVAGLFLPVMICVIVALASLLAAMADTAGAKVLGYVALAGGALWVVVLVAIVLVQAINALDRRDDTEQ